MCVLLTLWQQLAAARGHHGAVFGGLTMRTRRQLNVIAAVTVHKQAGQESRKNVYTCKQTSPSPNTHLCTRTHPTNTDTNNVSVYVREQPGQTSTGECGGMSAVQAQLCLCKSSLSKNPLIQWLMAVCVGPPSPFSHQPTPLLYTPFFSLTSGNSKYLSGGLPGVYAVLDVCNPGVFLQRVNGFQNVLSPIFHLWRQPSTEITNWALFKGAGQSIEHAIALTYSYSLFLCSG